MNQNTQADFTPQTLSNQNSQKDIKVTRIPLTKPFQYDDLNHTAQITQTNLNSLSSIQSMQLGSYIATQIGYPQKPINNTQTTQTTVIRNNTPGVIYSTNSYTKTYDSQKMSTRYNDASNPKIIQSSVKVDRPQNIYINSSVQGNTQSRHSNVNLKTTNNGKEIVKEVPIFLEKIIEKPVIVEKIVQIEVEKPVYIDKKVEVMKTKPITIERVVEKPVEKIVYLNKPNQELDTELNRLRDRVYILENENLRLIADRGVERVVEINKETVTTITDEHNVKEWENKCKSLEAKVSQLESANKKLEHENVRLKYDNELCHKEISIVTELKDKNHNLSDELHILKQKLITMNTLNEEKSQIDQKFNQETVKYKQEISELKNKYKLKLADIEASRSASDENLKKAITEIAKLKQTIESKDKNQNDISLKISDYETVIQKLRADSERLLIEIDNLKYHNTQLSHNLEESKLAVQRKLDDQHLSISELYKKQLDEYKIRYEDKSTAWIEISYRNERLEKYVSELETEKNELQRLVMDLQEQNRRLNERVDELEIKEEIVNDTTTGSKPYEAEIDPLADLKHKNYAMKNEYEQMMKNNISTMEQQLEEAYKRIAKKQEKTKQLKQKLSFSTFRLIAAVSELERLRHMVL